MPPGSNLILSPRKWPVQARSTASVDAILEATVQVLLSVGKEGLTTTKVANRAGVSVGTLYQYYPNKTSLLQAALRRHLETIADAVERVCAEQTGKRLIEMVTGLICGFLDAKLADPKSSVAMYSVSSDLNGARLSAEMAERLNRVVSRMLLSSCEPLTRDVQLVSAVLLGALGGVSRRLLEMPSPEEKSADFRRELIALARAYISVN